MATQILIPSPCRENWADMTPVQNACRHCAVCEKQITDFTLKTDAEILTHLHSSNGNICGRFRPDQLERPLLTGRTVKRSGLSAIAASFAAVLAAQQPIESQTTVPLSAEQSSSPDHQTKLGKIKHDLLENDSMRTISGKIVDEKGEPMVGASIRFAQSRFGAISNLNGEFRLRIPLDTLQTNPLEIGIRFPDYVGKTVELPQRLLTEDLSLIPAQTQMQPAEIETVIMGMTFVEESPSPKPRNRSFFYRLFH